MSLALRPLLGGLALPSQKEVATGQNVLTMPLPERLFIPLRQHIGEPANPIVEVGEKVVAGQCLGIGVGSMSAPIHAPVAGKIVGLAPRAAVYPEGAQGRCLELLVQAQGEGFFCQAAGRNPQTMDEQALWQCVADAGIVGMGGAGFPTSEKLHFGMQDMIETVIINAAECEPFISCDDMLLRTRAKEVIQGLAILIRLLDAERAFIAIEEDKKEAYHALFSALQAEPMAGVQLVQIPSRYPSGGEKQLIRILTGREVPSGSYPNSIGMYCQNVATTAAIYHAVRWGQPLISRLVTVAGSGVAQPANVEVLIGTPIRALIEFCGGYTRHAGRRQLVVGGPMMGTALEDDLAPVTKTTNCVLVVGEELAWRNRVMQPCIRCGECAEVCPMQLLPQQLFWHAQNQAMERLERFHLFDCIECGCCDYVCPSHIPLVAHFHCAKQGILQHNEMGIRAQRARQRFDTRQERLARQKREQEEKRKRRKEALRKAQKSS